MQRRMRSLLQSNRQFYTAVIILFVLLIGVVAIFQIDSLKRITRIVDSARDADRRQTCINGLFDLQDYSWDIFESDVLAINSAPVGRETPDSLNAILIRLSKLPGVRRAYCLEEGRELHASELPVPYGLTEALAGFRRTFATYYNGGERPTEKIDNMIQNRVRFLDVPMASDTLRMIVGAFDLTGTPIHILPALQTDPSQARYLVALELDPQWIRQAAARHLDETFHSRWAFVLWSPAPFDSSAQYLNGLGVIALGDTIWWRGLKTAEPGLVMPSGSGWFKYVAVYQEDPSDLQGRAAYFRSYYILLALGGAAAMVFSLLLVLGLVFVRKQWLVRQTALTHLAHAIRTPVARLRLDVDTLREKRTTSPEEEGEVVRSIDIECGRIERAVHNAALSLNDHGYTIERISGDLFQIVMDALKLWQPAFVSADVALIIPDRPESLLGHYDREMIVTVLDNLLDNALRHTRIQKQKNPRAIRKVIVGLRAEQRMAFLTVDDSDGGVPVADRQRIFRRFERGSDQAATGVSGLGLGLALVKEIAEAHGGRVRVDHSSLGGARFTVELPLG